MKALIEKCEQPVPTSQRLRLSNRLVRKKQMTVRIPSAEFSLPDSYTIASEATSSMFGGNILAPRNPMTGQGSYEQAINELGVTGLRYPGGSLTEDYFDIANPNQTEVTHPTTGATSKFIALSEFMDYAGTNGHEVTIVIPTRYSLSDTVDANGDRSPDIDEDTLRDFVHDLATGVYGDAPVAGLEIGNEYWGSGEMDAVEYGKLSSEMALIIKDELETVSDVYGTDTSNIKVLVQMGTNFNYSNLTDDYAGWDSTDVIDDLTSRHPDADISYDNIRSNGDVNWTEVNNELLLMSFDSAEKIAAIDGVIAHVYTYGSEATTQSNYWLDSINNIWLEREGFENLEIHVTEWNMKSTSLLDRNEDYGLFQAHEMLNIVETFMEAGVDNAHVWPLIQNTSNPMAAGMDYTDKTVPGEMFTMMAENMPGKTMLDFSPGLDRCTEYEAEEVDVHAFAGQGDLLLYIASEQDTDTTTDLDLSNLITGFASMEISVLGVQDGQSPGSTRSDADLQNIESSQAFADGVLQVDLGAREIMQVVIRDIQPTEEFAPTLAVIDGTAPEKDDAAFDTHDPVIDDDGETGLIRPDEPDVMSGEDSVPTGPNSQDIPVPTVPMPEVSEEQLEADAEDTEDDGGSGGFDGIFLALGLLPILAAFGM